MDTVTEISKFTDKIASSESPALSLRHMVEFALDRLLRSEDDRKIAEAKRITDLAIGIEREIASNM